MKKTRGKIINFGVKLNRPHEKLRRIRRVILVGSGKGGVGKSLVACGLALKLSKAGHNVGLLDIDIHGASVSNYLGLIPPLESSKEGLEPKMADANLKVMSISLLTWNYPVPVRGEEKDDLIAELISLTNWGEKIDFLIVDLPPGTGDELLSTFDMLGEKSSLVLVTTPSKNATAIVSRLAILSKREKIPIAGAVVNMAYSVNTEGKMEYPFGKTDVDFIQKSLGARILVQIPLEPAINTLDFRDIVSGENQVAKGLQRLAEDMLVSG